MHWLEHILGLDDGSGRWYLWWSGFGANFGEFAILLGIPPLYRRHNCHVRGCPRIGRFHVEGDAGRDWVVCHRHHPTGPPSAADIRKEGTES